MADFATLVLAADSRGLQSGEKALNSIAMTAERTESRTTKATAGLAKGYEQVGKQSIMAGQQSRMMAMQLSQVAQQASATGDWVRALAIQLPDLTLGFGTIGIAAGVAAGALLPLIANMVTGQEEGQEFSDIMDDLGASLKGYRASVDDAILPANDLIDKFGLMAESASRVYDAMRKIKELEFQAALRTARDTISETLSGVQEAIDKFNLASTSFQRPEAITAIRTEVQYLENVFGLTLIQATRVNAALDELAAATGPQEIADAAMRLGDELGRAREEGAQLSPDLLEVQKSAYEASRDAAEFAHLVGVARDGADGLASSVGNVADEAARAAQNAAAMVNAIRTQAVLGQLGNSPLNQLDVFNSSPFESASDIFYSQFNSKKSQTQLEQERLAKAGRKRGGSGRKDNFTDDMREAARIFDDTRTAAERYRKELDDLGELHQMGYMDADTYARAVAKVGEEYRNASEAGKFFNQIGEDLKNGILDAIIEGENLADTFESLAKSIARAALEAALFGTGPFAQGGGKGGSGGVGGGLLGGLLGGLFKLFSFDGGGYTGSGSRSGGVDGKGGFLGILHPNETVTDHTKGGGGAQVLVSVVSRFDANGNFETNVERISQKEVGKAAPGIVSAANQQVMPTIGRWQGQKAGGDWRSAS